MPTLPTYLLLPLLFSLDYAFPLAEDSFSVGNPVRLETRRQVLARIDTIGWMASSAGGDTGAGLAAFRTEYSFADHAITSRRFIRDHELFRHDSILMRGSYAIELTCVDGRRRRASEEDPDWQCDSWIEPMPVGVEEIDDCDADSYLTEIAEAHRAVVVRSGTSITLFSPSLLLRIQCDKPDDPVDFARTELGDTTLLYSRGFEWSSQGSYLVRVDLGKGRAVYYSTAGPALRPTSITDPDDNPLHSVIVDALTNDPVLLVHSSANHCILRSPTDDHPPILLDFRS